MRFSRRRQPQSRSAVAAWASVLLGLSLVLASFVLAVQPTAATGGGQGGTRDVQIEKDWVGGNGTSVTLSITYTDKDGNQQQTTRNCPANDGDCGSEIEDVKVGTTVTITEPSLTGWWTDPASLSCRVRSGNGDQDCTVKNHKLRDVQIRKKWDTDSGAGIGVPSGPVQLEIQSVLGSTTVTCNGTGTTWDCTPTIQAPVGTTVTLSEPSPPAGWAPRSADLSFTVPTSGSGTATHTVENKPVTRKLEVMKQWLTNTPPNQDVQLQVTVDDPGSGSPKQYNLTCKKSNQSTWSCGSVSNVQVGSSVTITEPNPPSGWQPVASTLSFTIPSGSGTYTHTVQNEPQTTGGGGGNGGTTEIEIKQGNFTKSCPQGQQVEWHFVITQIDQESNAPSSITATFQNAGTVTITREKFTGGTAHYTYYTSGSDTLITATATIYEDWNGQFNLSHAKCTGEPTTLKLRFKKVWLGDGQLPGDDVTLTVTVGKTVHTVTCQAQSTSTWTCTPDIDVEPDQEYTVDEPDVPDGWEVTGGTGDFTVPSKCENGVCVHTVTNTAETTPSEEPPYFLRVDKDWDGQAPEGAAPTLTLEVDAVSVTCTAGQNCPSEVIIIEPGDSYSVSETDLPEGWEPDPATVGEFIFDPNALTCETRSEQLGLINVTLVVCTHTVTNRLRTYELSFEKLWQGGAPPDDPITLTITRTRGQTSTQYTATCSGGGDSTTWTCGINEDSAIEIQLGDQLTIEESGLGQEWQADTSTLTLTVDADFLNTCNTDDECTHTVVNQKRGTETRYRIQVAKEWQGGPGGTFTLLLTSSDNQEIHCGAGGEIEPCSNLSIPISVGQSYNVSEYYLPEGWEPDPATVGDFTFDPGNTNDPVTCVEGDPVLEDEILVTTVTCTHTVVNLRQHYEIELVKQWVGGTPPSAAQAGGFELSAGSGENSIVCTWNGTALVCTPETLTVEWGDTFTVTESGLPDNWQNESGLGIIDPSTLQNCATSERLIRCTHTVVNRFQTQPSEEPERTLTLRKQWIGSGRPDSLVIEVTIGSETTEVTCSGSGSLWTCTPTLDLPAGDDVTVVIAEPDVPAGWETTSGTGTFTVEQLCGNAEDCTHTVVNRREQQREENPPSPPSNPPSSPPAPQPPVSEAAPITASPPVSEAAPATATPPTRVSEASPIVGAPPPQVLPKTGRGEGSSGMLWLLTGLGSLLMAAGCGVELHRRSRRGLRA
ncbi:hypothetical protein NET02_14290 [Thermomicrobiaceae bacterium CFH 74404]|uniref:Uncharacterized protein n=1 Tax=Thermalbibacter longus TaxID=2951981 RepID=A0AA41WC00_9BACT|nr:hypothetical protein [Thermalbibacter longus]MCM8750319.1 hypothetical protein [Thermalbibacter longus]